MSRCGNFYGSREVIKADFHEGMKIYKELNETYQFQNIDEFLNFCSKINCNRSFFISAQNSKVFPKVTTSSRWLQTANA